MGGSSKCGRYRQGREMGRGWGAASGRGRGGQVVSNVSNSYPHGIRVLRPFVIRIRIQVLKKKKNYKKC